MRQEKKTLKQQQIFHSKAQKKQALWEFLLTKTQAWESLHNFQAATNYLFFPLSVFSAFSQQYFNRHKRDFLFLFVAVADKTIWLYSHI